MRNKESKLQFYKRADITQPQFPERSLLFQIPPIGINTENVESFTGYLNRIAYEHCVSAAQLLKFCLFKSKRGRSRKLIYHSRNLNGLNYNAKLAVEILEEAILINEIRFTNLLPLQNILSSANLLKRERFWCPACLNDDAQKKGIAYEKLIWNLEINEVCSTHETVLFSICPYCSNNNACSHSIPYGFCLFCQKWLGNSLKGTTAYKGIKKFTSKSIWIEKELRSLLRLLPMAGSIFHQGKLLDALFYLVMSQMEGNISRFCRRYSLMELDFISLFIKGNLISLRKLVAICYPLNIRLVDLLKGEIPQNLIDSSIIELYNKERYLSDKYSQMFIDYDLYKTKKISKEEIERAKVVLKNLLNKEPIPFSKVCQIVGIRESILKRTLPILSLERLCL
jgi:hypothetical protein